MSTRMKKKPEEVMTFIEATEDRLQVRFHMISGAPFNGEAILSWLQSYVDDHVDCPEQLDVELFAMNPNEIN